MRKARFFFFVLLILSVVIPKTPVGYAMGRRKIIPPKVNARAKPTYSPDSGESFGPYRSAPVLRSRTPKPSQGLFELRDKEPFEHNQVLDTPSIFSISNPNGSIKFRAVDSSLLTVSAHYRGKKPAQLFVEEVQPGKIKISVEYPKGSLQKSNGGVVQMVGGNIVIRSGNSQNISIVGNKVYIDGREVSSNSSSSYEAGSSASADLEISVPRAMLASLKAVSQNGDILVEGFSSQDKFIANRFISLQTDVGKIELRNVLASAGITAKVCSGDICVEKTSADLELKTNQGNISVERNDGYVYAKTSQGNVVVTDGFGKLELESSQGDISASSGTGEVLAITSQGNIRVSNRTSRIAAETSTGNIAFDNPQSTSEYVKTGMGMVRGVRESVRCESIIVDSIPLRDDKFERLFDF